jgi:hypothetical protein
MIGHQLLYIERGDGAAVAHKALQCGDPRLATLDGRRQRALPLRLLDEAGTEPRLIPAVDLAPAAPLNAAEEVEYRRLDALLAGTLGEARTVKRFNHLRLRSLMFGAEK